MSTSRINLKKQRIPGMGLAIAFLITLITATCGISPSTNPGMSSTAAAANSGKKTLIEVGWDMPSPEFFRSHIRDIEKKPFDGVVVKLSVGKTVFQKTAHPDAKFTADQQALAGVQSSILTNNLVRMNASCEQGWNWFNDSHWAAAERNVRNFARTAKAGGFKGFAFDPEPYENNPWAYSSKLYPGKSFADVQAKVRSRGKQFMTVIQKELPDPHMLSFLGLYVVQSQTKAADGNQSRIKYALLSAFIDGWLDVASPNARIIDGMENSGYFYRGTQFDKGYQSSQAAISFLSSGNQERYRAQGQVGMSIYVDLHLDLFGSDSSWYAARMPHYLSASDRRLLLQQTVYHALRTTDQYVWVYSGNMDWWNNRIPEGAEDAVRQAKTKIVNGQSLGFNLDPAIDAAFAKCKAKRGATCK